MVAWDEKQKKGKQKMKMKVFAGAAIASVILAVSGCYSYPGTIQDKSKPIAQDGYTVVGNEVSATELQVFLFGVPMSDLRGSAGRRMYKNALAQAPGSDALIEYTTDMKMVNLNFLMFQWYTLTGVPVKTTK